jgi:hypothetical protein
MAGAMAEKRTVAVTPDGLRKLSAQIYQLYAGAEGLRNVMWLFKPNAKDEQKAVDTINSLLRQARRINQQESSLFYFERAYATISNEESLLDGRFTSYHERAIHTAYSFLMRLLTHEADTLPAPDNLTYVPPEFLSKIDLEVAVCIANLYREDFSNEHIHAELSTELTSAANMLADSTGPIPAEFRTKAMTKQQAAAYFNRPNPDSGVRWLNRCIADELIRCEPLSRQSFIFDSRQFPASVQHLLFPTVDANSR